MIRRSFPLLRRRRLASALTAIVLLVATAGCGGGEPEVLTPILRFIDQGPQELFESTDVARPVDVLVVDPDETREDGGWRVEGVVIPRGMKDGRILVKVPEEGTVSFTRALREPPPEIDFIEVELGGLQPHNSVRLLWAEDGQDFKKGRSLSMGARRGEGARVKTFRFRVGIEPTWSEDVRALRIEVRAGVQNIHLGPVIGRRLDLDPELLADARGRAWICERNGTHRSALLGGPERSIERTVSVPDGASLRFGVGVPANRATTVDYRVSVAPLDGAETPTEVYRHTAGNEDDAGWVDAEVDLSVFSGREVRISLESEIAEPFDPVLGMPVWANPVVWAPSTGEPAPNVVLISLDTLRADHMSLYGYERATTPELDAWARRRAVVFETVVAPSPWTLPSHVSMLTGVDAVGHGINHAVPAPATVLTIAELLHSRGYATAAVTGGSYLHPRFGLAQGFEDYRSYKGDLTRELETEIDQALSWIDDHAGRAPWFFFLHTYEVHDPYDPREPFFSEFSGGPPDEDLRDAVTRGSDRVRPDRLRSTNRFVLRDRDGENETRLDWNDLGVITDLYDSGIAFTDLHLRRILDRLSQRDLADNTVVIVTSDHGEALGEHRLAGHTSLYDHDILVPLVVAFPGGRHGGRRVAAQVRSVDIAATVLDLAGMSPSPGIDGLSLLPLVVGDEREPRDGQSYTALSNHGFALRTGSHRKYIFRNVPWPIPAGYEELYDLERDPGERENIADRSAATAGLRRTARETLGDRLPGLRLVLRNTGDRGCAIEFKATGMVIGPSSIKTHQGGGGCRIEGMGRVGCVLDPGMEITLVGERVESPGVEISGSFGVESVAHRSLFTLGFDIGADREPRTVVLGKNRDAASSGETGGGLASMTVSWMGDPGILGLDPAETDAELRRQLEALGYIQ